MKLKSQEDWNMISLISMETKCTQSSSHIDLLVSSKSPQKAMNQLGDMGNKEKEITTRLPHKEGRKEGRKEEEGSPSWQCLRLTTYAQ
jgi:hypothetical protein